MKWLVILGIIVIVSIVCLFFPIVEGGNEELASMIDQLDILQKQYNNTFKVYSEDPEKYAQYREEFLEWQQKIEDSRNEYFFKVLKDSSVTEEWQYEKVAELIAILELFQEWKKGKIE